FFFQAEDGIRDRNVTGVQTCALPIYRFVVAPSAPRKRCRVEFEDEPPVNGLSRREERTWRAIGGDGRTWTRNNVSREGEPEHRRSEERRVGKECRTRGSRDQEDIIDV